MSFKFYVDEVNQGEGTRVPDGWFEPILREEDLAAAVAANRGIDSHSVHGGEVRAILESRGARV